MSNSDKIGTHEAFDSEVEAGLDQVTFDEEIRGKIRWMLLTMSRSNTKLHYSLKGQLLDLRKQYDEMRAEMLKTLEDIHFMRSELADEPSTHTAVAVRMANAAFVACTKYSSEPTEAQKEDVRKNGVPEDTL